MKGEREVISGARVRHWRARPESTYAPYPGQLHVPDSDAEIDWQEAVREELWSLPEGAKVSITVSYELPEPGAVAKDDFWVLLSPHSYGPYKGGVGG
jgi:hypothetical protein